jgi:hypothetical protein
LGTGVLVAQKSCPTGCGPPRGAMEPAACGG